MENILTTILRVLTQGIGTFAQGLGSGLKALVENIFLNVTTIEGVTTYDLSVFGYIIVIFAAISLVIALSRWVMMVCTSFGARK